MSSPIRRRYIFTSICSNGKAEWGNVLILCDVYSCGGRGRLGYGRPACRCGQTHCILEALYGIPIWLGNGPSSMWMDGGRCHRGAASARMRVVRLLVSSCPLPSVPGAARCLRCLPTMPRIVQCVCVAAAAGVIRDYSDQSRAFFPSRFVRARAFTPKQKKHRV